MSQVVRTNCPRDCYDGCGIVASVDGTGRARISGDPDHPIARGSLCAKCGVAYNGVFQDTGARLRSPLRRVGPKGAGQFESVTWDEALAEIAAKLQAVLADSGPDAILSMNYSGTLSLIAQFFPHRWMNSLGVAEVDYGTICNAAGYVAWDLLFGGAEQGFDPRTAKDSSCILVWGANPSHSAPHAHQHWLNDSPAKVITVDPVRTQTAVQSDLHLQPRPGTDAALAFGLLHALLELDRLDLAFIDSHVIGFEEVLPQIKLCTPERCEALTGVHADDIRLAARHYGAGPSLLWCGQGLQRQPRGGNIMRSVGLLPALTGNIGKPGAGFCYLNLTPVFAGVDLEQLVAADLAKKEPKKVGALDLAERLLDSKEFQAFVVFNTNPLASCSDQQKLRKACARQDLFTVVIDLFETDTVKFADYVLPAASFLEFNDITFSYFNLIMGAQTRVLEPLGESLPNQEIFRRLAKAMALDEPALFEDDDSIIATILEQCQVGYDFEALCRRGYFYLDDNPLIFFEDLKFGTPSGKIEVASEKAVAAGLPRIPSPDIDEPPPEGQLRLLSPASNWRLNDSYANDVRLSKRAGAPEIIIHQSDAARFGIESGARVLVANAAGSLELTAQIDDIVLPGTALSYKGRWPGSETGGKNLNFLHTGQKNDMGDSSSVHGIFVTVSAI